MMVERIANIKRKTNETDIDLTLNLDGEGKSNVLSGVRFLDHMLEGFAKHGLFDLTLSASGDLGVDGHHTVEDIGIVLGTAIKEAVGDKVGIRRFGNMILPMDDALVLTAIDLSGRPYFVMNAEFSAEKVGDLDTALVREFFYAVSYAAGMNLHIWALSGQNDHHITEGMFKAFAKALDEAVSFNPRIKDILTTKGSL